MKPAALVRPRSTAQQRSDRSCPRTTRREQPRSWAQARGEQPVPPRTPHARTPRPLRREPETTRTSTWLQVLAGVCHSVDRTPRLTALLAGNERADEHDPLALLAGDPGPVAGVGGVR